MSLMAVRIMIGILGTSTIGLPVLGQCQLLMRETFRLGERPHGGNGRLRTAAMEEVLKDYWPQTPQTGARWLSVDANSATWRFNVTSTDPSEVPADDEGGTAWADGNATAVIPIAAQSGTMTAAIETVIFAAPPAKAYMGFTSDAALLNNFETHGSLWMSMDADGEWAIHANGSSIVASGTAEVMGTLDSGWLHMEFTYDPASSTVSGRVMGTPIPPTPVTVTSPLAYFGIEAHGGMVVMNNAVVSTGTPVAVSAIGDGVACPGGTLVLTAQTNATTPSIIRWCNQYGWPLSDGPQASGAIVSGAETSVLTITGVSAAEAGNYFAMVANECARAISNRVTVTVGGCPADHNCSGQATVQDIFDFLGDYFGGSSRADFNRAGGVTVQDLFDFLAAYFAGCTN